MKFKFIGALTALIMLISSVSVGAAAKTADSVDSDSVKLLNALGIMGIDESANMFWDDSLVERRELARILCSLMKLTPTADGTPKFTDVGESDRPYIEMAAAYGYMNGTGENEFEPKSYVTREQLIKIFVSVLEADEFAEYLGGYPNGYIQIAQKLKITGGLSGNFSGNATRIEVANVIYDCLHIDVPTLSGVKDGQLVYQAQKDHTFLSEHLKIYRGSGIMSGNESTMLDSDNRVSDGQVMIDGALYDDPKDLGENMLGHNVTVYVYRPDGKEHGEIVYIEDNYSNAAVRVSDEDFISVNDFAVKYRVGDREKSLTLSTACNMIYNGRYVTYDPKYYDGFSGYIDFVDSDKDGRYDVVKITDFDTFVVLKVSEKDEKLILDHGFGTISLKDNHNRIYLNGERTTLDKIGVGMVISAAVSEGAEGEKSIRLEACSNRIIGAVEREYKESGDRYIVLNGADYRLSQYCENLISNETIEDVKAGKTAGQFFTDYKGDIAYHSASGGNSTVGYLTRSVIKEDGFDKALLIKIYTAEGKFDTYTSDEKIKIDGVSKTIDTLAKEYDVINRLKTPQLIEYKVSGDVLKEINFAYDGYDPQKFSKDMPSAEYEHYSSTLNHRYGVTAKTQVFKVPSVNKNAADFDSVIDDESNFYIYTGSYFSGRRSHSNVTLYDVMTDGEVKYIVVEYDPKVSTIRYTDPTILVEGVHEGIDEDGNTCDILAGYDEGGNYVEIPAPSDKDAAVDSSLGRAVKFGDVVQYNKNTNGKLAYVKVRKSVDSTDFTPIENVDWEYYMFISYGQVYKTSAEKFYLTTNALSPNMTPLDTSMMVGDTGVAVYRANLADKKIYKIDFADIEYGDKVYACVNDRNYARMIVVFE